VLKAKTTREFIETLLRTYEEMRDRGFEATKRRNELYGMNEYERFEDLMIHKKIREEVMNSYKKRILIEELTS